MDVEAVPPALGAQLGPEATLGLLALFERVRPEWANDVIATCSERFERRLVAETSALRIAIVEGDAAVRQDIARSESTLRQEIARSEGALRQEIGSLEKTLRQEIGSLEKTLRQEIGTVEKTLRSDLSSIRVDLFKWSFVFWIGQVVAVAGIVGAMLRFAGR